MNLSDPLNKRKHLSSLVRLPSKTKNCMCNFFLTTRVSIISKKKTLLSLWCSSSFSSPLEIKATVIKLLAGWLEKIHSGSEEGQRTFFTKWRRVLRETNMKNLLSWYDSIVSRNLKQFHTLLAVAQCFLPYKLQQQIQVRYLKWTIPDLFTFILK